MVLEGCVRAISGIRTKSAACLTTTGCLYYVGETEAMDAMEFNKLSLGQRVDLLWAEGVRLFEYVSEYNHINVIYGVFNFFVEVNYTKESYGLKNIKALETELDWDGYLGKVDLEELFKKT